MTYLGGTFRTKYGGGRRIKRLHPLKFLDARVGTEGVFRAYPGLYDTWGGRTLVIYLGGTFTNIAGQKRPHSLSSHQPIGSSGQRVGTTRVNSA